MRICVLVFIALASSTTARADDCACAVAACTTMMSAQHKSTSSCAQLGKQTAQCTTVATNEVMAIKTLGLTTPNECGSLANAGTSSSNSSSSSSSSASQPPASPSPPPTPLPPDTNAPTHSTTGSLACEIDRTGGGTRVMVAGATASFALTCTGTTAAPKAVWSSPVGMVAPLGMQATWQLPQTAPKPADVQIQAVVTAGTDKVTVVRTVHVVARHLTLNYRGEIVNKCKDVSAGGGSLNVGFDLVCSMSIELTVGDDLSVKSTGSGKSCGAGQVSAAQLCVPQGETKWEAVPGWSFDSASGSIDNTAGIMSLNVAGNRIGLVRVTFVGGKTNDVHTGQLFEQGFTMMPDDGSFRSFGSLTTTPTTGSTNAFTIAAH